MVLSIWLYWDFSQAERKFHSHYKVFKPLRICNNVTTSTTKVAIVRSDDPQLDHPIPVDDGSIDYPEIEDMTRRAIELAGRLDWIIESGDMVLLKPNIVDPKPPGSGEVTDVRVIKALIKIIDEIDHGHIEIVVGEGSPRPMDYEMAYQSKFGSPEWEKLWDTAGYQDLLTDPYLDGIDFRLSNLNGSPPENPWEDLVEAEVAGGGEADPQEDELGIIKYYIHKDVLDADVFITVPVMKIHDPGITVALKNQIGLAPSTMYGFSKTAGVQQDNYQHRLVHTSQLPKYWTHKEIVDLSNLANIRFAVVDAIMCLELQKTLTYNNQVRMNTIVAGADPVAVDHVCARLMCLNPDDIEHITLAERVGLGTNDPDLIHIEGADLDKTKKRFRKNQKSTADFGQSNRFWLLKGPYSVNDISDPIHHEFISNEINAQPEAETDGWSEPIYFRDDHIDLKSYFNIGAGEKVIGYAFTYFDAPRDQEAELWIGSDEALKIYINCNEVYCYNGNRTLAGDRFVSEKINIQIQAGENSLLVKSLQQFSRYDFCLNICEPETNPYYDGNRIWGLKFKTDSNNSGVKQREDQSIQTYKIHKAFPNPFNGAVKIVYEVPKTGEMTIIVYNLIGQPVKILSNIYHKTIGQKTVSWDGTDETGHSVASGTYVVAFQGLNGAFTNKKLIYLK